MFEFDENFDENMNINEKFDKYIYKKFKLMKKMKILDENEGFR